MATMRRRGGERARDVRVVSTRTMRPRSCCGPTLLAPVQQQEEREREEIQAEGDRPANTAQTGAVR